MGHFEGHGVILTRYFLVCCGGRKGTRGPFWVAT